MGDDYRHAGHITTYCVIKMDSNLGDLPNETTEMQPVRNGIIVTLRKRVHINACLGVSAP